MSQLCWPSADHTHEPSICNVMPIPPRRRNTAAPSSAALDRPACRRGNAVRPMPHSRARTYRHRQPRSVDLRASAHRSARSSAARGPQSADGHRSPARALARTRHCRRRRNRSAIVLRGPRRSSAAALLQTAIPGCPQVRVCARRCELRSPAAATAANGNAVLRAVGPSSCESTV
jgi:hypothetical protein